MKVKAAICSKYGPPGVLKIMEIDKPVPKEGEVCVKIYATSVTTGDVVLRALTLPKLIYRFFCPWHRSELFGNRKTGRVFYSTCDGQGKPVLDLCGWYFDRRYEVELC